MLLLPLEGRQEHENPKPSILPAKGHPAFQARYPMPQGRSDINTCLPMELLREICLYSIEDHQMKSGQLASVCRHWRSVIISITSLWSTWTVITWTEREQVATWLQRAYPKKVVIDTQRYAHIFSNASFVAPQDALASTDQWNEQSWT